MKGRRVRFEDYEVDFARRELRKDGRRLNLQPKPLRVLEMLLRNPGELVTREALVGFLWPDSHVSFAHGLNTAVNALRNALGETSRNGHFIETRSGLGYRFIAPVTELPEPVLNGNASGHSIHTLDAYQTYLKGRYFLDRMTAADTYKAMACFKSAGEDESYRALAHAGIADACCQLASLGVVGSSQIAEQARASSGLALAYDPDLADAHVAAGRLKMLLNWDWDGAREAANRALALEPGCTSAHLLKAALLCISGDYQASLQVCRQALLLDPLSFAAQWLLSACLYAARNFESALNRCWEMLSLLSNFAPAQILLAQCYEQLGLHEEAIIEFQNAQRCGGRHPAITSGLSHVFCSVGREGETPEAFADLSEQSATGYVSPYWHAVIFAGCRQMDQALASLEEAFRMFDPAALWLTADARFDELRSHPGFQKLLQRLETGSESRLAAAAC
jgi:DNA-binding winged helix-turn-helix (wHTH) protein/Flp pilus assembly protein TadD